MKKTFLNDPKFHKIITFFTIMTAILLSFLLKSCSEHRVNTHKGETPVKSRQRENNKKLTSVGSNEGEQADKNPVPPLKEEDKTERIESPSPLSLPDFDQTEKEIKDTIASSPGDVGLILYDMQWERTISVNPDEIFESASMVKVPVMAEVFLQQQEGKLRLDQTLTLRDDQKAGGAGILKDKPSGTEYSVEELLNLMITQSDNTATDMLIELVGMESVENRMSALGLKNTTLKRKIYDFNAIDEGRDNYTTPEDMYILFKWIYGENHAQGQENPDKPSVGKSPLAAGNPGTGSINILTAENRDKILDILKKQERKDMIPRFLPEGLAVAHKTGGLLGILHDGGIIFPPGRKPYILIIMGKNVSDEEIMKEKYGKISETIYQRTVNNQSPFKTP